MKNKSKIPPVEESSAPVESSPVETNTTEAVDVQPQQESVWDAFKGLPEFEGQDDTSIARSLYESMEREKSATRNLQQYQQLILYAQEYMQHKDAFDQWRNGQAQQPQPQQPSATSSEAGRTSPVVGARS